MLFRSLHIIDSLPPTGMNYISLSEPVNLRYVRYQVPEGAPTNHYNNDNVYCCNLAEIALYGTELDMVRGDANADSVFNVADVVMLQKWLCCSGELTNWMNVDLNEDGRINVFDLCLVKRELLNN